ncbi:glutathione S-transferase [Parvularcula sp. ZS-1/3]|uniref:Glutathione S-transferase n=1 Tax=Parvularcula mediterranea TaxID=2732508 RepID=A0A7Y3RLM7_9PROT|nr:glutathione S-transferase [Parvularcula mediterranea]NNU16366.1 glutathione S-transferase [Parvularcula mediterranea]
MGETLPTLYSFRRCPYAMRARMALVVTGQRVMLRELILRDKPPEMLAASPKGTVPVLVLPNGEVIDESLAVMDWAASKAPDAFGLPTPDGAQLIERNDGQFKRDLDRYKYPTRYEDVDPLEHRASGAEFLTAIDEALSGTGQLQGQEAGYTDYAVFPFIRQFRIADPEWFDAQPWPQLHPWLQAHITSDLFKQIMRKYSLFAETGEEHEFGCPSS